MAEKVLILLGTKKGVFIAESDDGRRVVVAEGAVLRDLADEPRGRRPGDRHDLRRRRQCLVRPGGVEIDRPRRDVEPFERGARLCAKARSRSSRAGASASPTAIVYAGVQPAGLFRSGDGGESWEQVKGLSDHPTRPQWNPGGAGLILHSLVIDPDDHDRLWVGISAAGVFHSADGGKTWEPRNKGTRADFMPDDQRYPEFGQCVHCVVKAPGMSDRLYQQNHCGMYRSDDAGKSWQSIEAGLPSSFGFPAAAHPRDPETLYLLPLNGDIRGRYVPDGQGGGVADARRRRRPGRTCATACRRRTCSSACCARRWRPTGSTRRASISAPRRATLYASADEGESWTAVAEHLPTILSVETMVVEVGAMDAPGAHAATESEPATVTVTLAGALTYLFPGAPRRLTVRGGKRARDGRRARCRLAGHGRPHRRFDPGDPPPHERLRRRGTGGARHAAPAPAPRSSC